VLGAAIVMADAGGGGAIDAVVVAVSALAVATGPASVVLVGRDAT
jgi:hypothetical protein